MVREMEMERRLKGIRLWRKCTDWEWIQLVRGEEV